ncbi:MAG: N-acetylmuramoyl-L-alanine amidase [Ginsengibacter sp.]
MITLGWYLLKVIICSGILTAYYFLALRNKAFHRWNRFFLLATVVLSLIVPLMKINIFQPAEDKGTVVQLLQTISYGDEAVVEYSRNNSFQLSTQTVTEGIYLLVVLVFLFVFFHSLYRINRLKRKNFQTYFDDISFINTNAKGTPFSFFKNIFWNDAIELQSKTGQHIFQHELAHVKERHSYDKVFMNIVLIFFWVNPFYWLLCKELYMIHEFIADKEALEDSDISAFAEMVLQSVYPGQNFALTNNFFYSPLKRRLLMLAKNKNPKVSYISRLLVLPVAAIVFFAFTLKVKKEAPNLYKGKTITVVIDAGHGGDDNGAVSSDGIKEKDITLSIAKKILQLNSNQNIKILLSRSDDESVDLKSRVEFAEKNNANAFVSIHVNASADKQLNGFSVLIDKKNSQQNMLLGSTMINHLKESYKTEDKIGTRTNGVWVLDHNVCPAALLNCGYLSNSSDEAFITNSANQDKIAQDILEAINAYASSEEGVITGSEPSLSSSVAADTVPAPPPPGLPPHYFESKALFVVDGKISTNKKAKEIDPKNIEKIYFLKGQKARQKFGEKGKDGVIEITTKNHVPGNAIIIIDGKQSTKDELNKIPPAKIESVRVFKGESAIKKYGDKAKEGAILIVTKKNQTPFSVKDSIPDKVFTKVQVEASFPGGQQAWQKYIAKVITDSISKFTKTDYGTCVVRFIVNVDGTVSDVVATTMKGSELAKITISAIKNGPKWIPASQNGKAVAAYRLQPVTLKSPDKKSNSASSATNEDAGKVFVKADKPAEFPGGPAAWSRYISRKIIDSMKAFTDKDYGTCVVRFIVGVNGSVSDVMAITMKGTKLAEVAVNAIKHGPEWIPAQQNGHPVNSFREQPVTLQNSHPSNSTPKSVSETNSEQEKPMAVFTKLQKPASFPGGNTAWLKYITGVIQKNANALTADKESQGRCEVKFIVDKDGSVSDVKAITKQDSKLAEVAFNAIANGPRWVPGMQNGRVVNSFVTVPVAFVMNDELAIQTRNVRLLSVHQ